jgi:hypothetical protein
VAHARETVRGIYGIADPALPEVFVARLVHDLKDESCLHEMRQLGGPSPSGVTRFAAWHRAACPRDPLKPPRTSSRASSVSRSGSAGSPTTASASCSTPADPTGTYSPPSHPAQARSAPNRHGCGPAGVERTPHTLLVVTSRAGASIVNILAPQPLSPLPRRTTRADRAHRTARLRR